MNLIAEVDQRYRRAFDQANNQVEELQRQLRELQNSRGPDRARREVEDLADQTKKAGGAFGKLSSAASSLVVLFASSRGIRCYGNIGFCNRHYQQYRECYW